MIVESTKQNGITIYVVKNSVPEEEIFTRVGKFCTNDDFDFLIDHDADVITTEGKTVLRFRKRVLTTENTNIFYDNVIAFAKTGQDSRISAGGGRRYIASNIYGYYDKWTMTDRQMFNMFNTKAPSKVRLTSFTRKYPEKWNHATQLIKEIDQVYKTLAPDQHKKQLTIANQTAYHIPQTSFTTVTTNYNVQTSIHTDKGDFVEGLGNLAVIERGKYDGGYLVVPEYKIAVNVRDRDLLLMDVHKMHGNTEIIKKSKDAARLSIVCYLRTKVVELSNGTTKEELQSHIDLVNSLTPKFKEYRIQKNKERRESQMSTTGQSQTTQR